MCFMKRGTKSAFFLCGYLTLGKNDFSLEVERKCSTGVTNNHTKFCVCLCCIIFFPGRFYSECATPQPTLNVFVSPIGLSGCNRVFTISLSTPRLPQNMRPLITRANPASVVLLEIEWVSWVCNNVMPWQT